MSELTILFADIAQSTALFEKYGDDILKTHSKCKNGNLIKDLI